MGQHPPEQRDPPTKQTHQALHVDLRKAMSGGELPYLSMMDALAGKPLEQQVHFHCLDLLPSLELQLREMGYQVETQQHGPDHWVVRVR